MKRKIRSCVAMLLTVSTVMTSMPISDITVFAEEATEAETATEAKEEASKTVSLDLSNEEEPKASVAVQEDANTEAKTAPETTEKVIEKAPETNSESAPETNKEPEATEKATETATEKVEETGATEKETEKATEKATEAGSEKTTEKDTEKATEPETKETNVEDTEKESNTEKVTSVLEISVNNGGKVTLKDKDNKVIKEVTYVDTAVKPFELEREEGTVITIDIEAESERYNVATYRLMTDKGKVIEDNVFEAETSKVSKTFTFGTEKRCLLASFAEKEEAEEELAPVKFSIGEGCERLVVTCDGEEGEITPEEGSTELPEAYFPVGKEITVEAKAKEGYEVSTLKTSTGINAEDGKLTFILKDEEGLTVTAEFEEAEEATEGKVFKTKGPGVVRIYEEGSSDPVKTLKDGESWTVEGDVLSYKFEMDPNDLSLPYMFSVYNGKKLVDSKSYLWVNLNPGEGKRAYEDTFTFSDTEDAEKVVFDFRSIESLGGIPTASGDNTESTDKDFRNLKRTSGASMYSPKVGDVFAARAKVSSHFQAHNYFSSQAPMKVNITSGTDYKAMWDLFGGKLFKLYKCASTTNECCPYYGTPGTLYFIVKSVKNGKVSGKLFFKNDYRHTLSRGYYWQSAHGTDSYELDAITFKKAVYVDNDTNNMTELDKKGIYDKQAEFDVYKSDKSTKVVHITTNDKGIAAVNLDSGTYYLKETKAPTYAQKANGWFKLVIDSKRNPKSITYEGTTPGVDRWTTITDNGGDKSRIVVANNYYGFTIRIKKREKDKKTWNDSLKGAVFGVYSTKDCKKESLVEEIKITGPETASKKKYPFGNTFYVKEITPPTNYKKNDAVFTVNPSKSLMDGKNALDEIDYDLVVANTPDAYIQVKVTKAAKGEMPGAWRRLSTYDMSGAEFGIYSDPSCNNYLGSVVTGASGVSDVLKFPKTTDIGEYVYVKELEGPESNTWLLNTEILKAKVNSTAESNVFSVVANFEEDFKAIDMDVIYKAKARPSSLSVAGAVFELRFKQQAQGPLAGNPTYTWQFRIKADGHLDLTPTGLVSGDASVLWYTGGRYLFPAGYYDVVEIQAPSGMIKSDGVYNFDCKDCLTGNAKIYQANLETVINTPDTGYCHLTKTSANTTITDGNAMYSLEGAEFTLYDGNGTPSGTLITKADGTTDTIEVLSGTYTVKETKTPKGYKKAPDTTVTVTRDQIAHIQVADQPVYGSLEMTVQKKPDGVTTKPLPNAQFKVEYFDNLDCAGTPKKTWVLKSNAAGDVHLTGDHLVSGDTLYGDNVVPLGSVKVTEVLAPSGFEADTNPKTTTITQDGENAVFGTFFNNPVVVNVAHYGGVKIDKDCIDRGSNPSGDATLAGAVFAVYNDNDYIVQRPDAKNTEIVKGQEVCRFTTNAEGLGITQMLPTDDGFKYPLMTDSYYIIREIEPSTGYLLPNGYEKRFYVPDIDGTVVDLTGEPVVEPIIRGGIQITKEDSEFKREGDPQGDATLEGAQFTITNKSINPVKVNGKEYAVGEVVMTLTTDANGYVTTGEKALPYGTYEVRETKPSEGYLLNTYKDTIQIRNDGEYVWAKSYEAKLDTKDYWYEDVIHFNIDLFKFKDTLSSEEPTDRVVDLHGIEFSITNVSKHNVLVDGKEYAPGSVVMTITTDEYGFATTQGKGCKSGALPYGKYKIHEVNCPAELVPIKDFVVDGTETGGVYDGKTYKGIYLNDKPVESRIRIRKVDSETGKTIPQGAKFQILDENKRVMDFRVTYPTTYHISEFTTNENGIIETPEKLPYGTYYLREIDPPYDRDGLTNGYVLGEDLEFKVTEYNTWEDVIEVTYSDVPTKGKLQVTKVDADTNQKVVGAVYAVFADADIVTGDGTVRHKKGDQVDVFTIGADGTGSTGDLYLGQYHLQEIKAPRGYCLDNTVYPFTLKYDESKKSTPVLVTIREESLKNKPTVMKLYKDDIDGLALDGIKFELTRIKDIEDSGIANDLAVDGGTYVTANGGNLEVKYLVSGVYSLTEVETLPGYVLDSKPRYVTVDNNGFIFESDAEGNNLGEGKGDTVKLHWVNDYTKWDFSKVDVTGDKELKGAEMEILNSEGKKVYEWTSTGELHRIVKIPLGKYTLVEKTAPKGYVIARSVEFEVINTGVVQKATMIDKIVTAHKVDMNAENMVGATLEVYEVTIGESEDKEATMTYGDLVDTWVSDENTHDIDGLEEGKDYVLVEKEAPEGWVKANPVVFHVSYDKENQDVTMTDIRVKAHKYDETAETYVVGASLEVRDADDNVVDSWITTDEYHYISGLEAGKSYSLVEVKSPDGFAKALPVKFTVLDNGKDQEVTMINKKVIVSKVDTSVKELAGAHLRVVDKDGNTVDEWVSDGKPHDIKGLEVGQTYTLIEDIAPEGYAIASPITFAVEDNAKNDEFNLINKQVFVHKQDVTGEKEIPGAKLQVKDLEGNIVDEWTSTEEAHPISNIRVNETYILHEEVAPDGYVIANDIEFTVMDDFKPQHVEMVDKQVLMSKVDVTGEKEIPGATIIVYDKDGKEVDKWVSEDKPHAIKNLKVEQTYVLHEEVASEGYVVASDIKFTVLDDKQNQKVTMIDKQVFMTKYDVTGEKEVPGATIVVYDKNGNEKDRWVSEDKPHAIKNLKVKETYVLHEEVAADGYVVASDVEFTVDDDFKNQDVKMLDKQVFMSKLDVTGEKEIPGATIVVKDKDGKEVDKWVSEDKPHAIKNLKVKETYTLHEEVAAEGYVVASDVQFTVDDDFKNQKVEMKDKQVFVSKKDITTGDEIEGAHLIVKDEKGNTVDEWDSVKDEEHPISGLEVGKKYTLIEETAPDGYVTAEEIEFTVEDDFTIQHVEMLDDYTKVEISKQDITTEKELPGAKLVIKNEDGEVVEEWTSTNEPHYIEYLPVGKYTLHEDAAPNGYKVASDVEFEVEDTGEVQKVVMKDERVPEKKLPQTGENMTIFVGAAVLLLLAVIALVLLKRRKRTK